MIVLEVVPSPLGRAGEILLGLTLGSFAGIWALGIYAYIYLPEEIPLHFDFNGNPISYSPKWMFLIVPAVFSPAPLAFILMTKFRYTLVRKYPYLLNIPPSLIEESNLTPEERGRWINRIFEAVLILGAILSFWLLVLEYIIYLGAVGGKMPPLYISSALLSVVVMVLVYVYLYLRSLSREIQSVW